MELKKYLTIIFISLCTVIVQTSVFYEFFGHYLNPVLLFSLVLGLLLNSATQSAYIAAIFGGLLLDFLTAETPGLSALILSLYIWFYVHTRNFYLRSTSAIVIFSAIFIYLYRTVLFGGLFFNLNVATSSVLSVALGYLTSRFMKKGYEKIDF